MKKVIVGGLSTIILIASLLMGYFILLKPEANKQKELQKLVEKIEISTETVESNEESTKEKQVEVNTSTTAQPEVEKKSEEAKEKIARGGVRLYGKTLSEEEMKEEPTEEADKIMAEDIYSRDLTGVHLTVGNLLYYLKQGKMNPEDFEVKNVTYNIDLGLLKIEMENTEGRGNYKRTYTDNNSYLLRFLREILIEYIKATPAIYNQDGYMDLCQYLRHIFI